MTKPRKKAKAGATRVTLLNRFPRHTPALEVMLGDLGDPTDGEVARALGVDRSTVSGWRRRGRAPRPSLLALYYLTRWGQSDVHCQAHNDAQLAAMTADMLRRQLDAALAQLAQLGQIGDFGSANDPLPGVSAAAPVEPLVSVPGEPRENTVQPNETARLHRAN